MSDAPRAAVSDRGAERPGPHASLAGRRAVVMGLGSYGGGLGAARYLVELGARVTVTDLRRPEGLSESLAGLGELDVELVLGRHDEADFAAAELVVANPAVPQDHALLAVARRAGACVTTEIELALEALPGRLVGITGTQGKSSTCRMLADLIAGAGGRVHVGGNLGGSLLGERRRIGADDHVVLELSSYQLEALAPLGAGDARRRLRAVGITNLLADHLERHGSLAAYHAAKLRLLELLAPGGCAVLPAAAARAARGAADRRVVELREDGLPGPGLHVREGGFHLDDELLAPLGALRASGRFQRWNALLALGLARELGFAPAALTDALGDVRVPEHRMQDLGLVAGRRVWDNAISTTPDSTVAALESLAAPAIVLCGGQAKRALDYERLAREAARRCRSAVTFGAAAGELAERFERAGLRAHAVETVAAAVERAFAALSPGDELLFSPACASFDAYPNVIARAADFRRALERLEAR